MAKFEAPPARLSRQFRGSSWSVPTPDSRHERAFRPKTIYAPRRHGGVCDRPQRGHGLGWREGQVEPSYRGSQMRGRLHDGPMQLARPRGCPAELEGEPFPGQVGPQPVTHRLRDRRLVLVLPRRQPATEFDLERGRLIGVDRVALPESFPGFRLAPKSNFICSLVTGSPGSRPTPSSPSPCQWLGDSPLVL